MLGTKIPELMKFPSSMTFKVVADKGEHLEEEGRRIFAEHGFEGDKISIAHKLSKNEKYQSMSITFTVESPEQMESLYKALATIKGVKMVI